MSEKGLKSKQAQNALMKDIDIWMIRDNLKLSYEERIAQHQNTLELIEELKQIGRQHRAKTSKSIKNINP